MSYKKTNKYKKKHNGYNKGGLPGSGTSDYYRNKRLILGGETFRSQKSTRPEKAPSRYKARF